MATKLAAGTAKNLNTSNPKYLGTKLYDGEKAQSGNIIVRQRGTKILPGDNVQMGKDHTLFAVKEGTVKYGRTRKTHFDGKTVVKKIVHVK